MATHSFTTVCTSFDEVYGRLPMPVFLFDSTTQIIKANKAFCDLAQVSSEKLSEYSIADFFAFLHTSRFPVPDHYVTELKTTDGRKIPVELNHTKFFAEDKTAQGCLVFLADLRELQTLKDDLQQVTTQRDALEVQLAGDAPDSALRERLQLEQQIKEEKTFLENVLESCGDGIFITDGRGIITRVNESFAKILGKDKTSIIGKKLYDLGPSAGTYPSTTGETVVIDHSYQEYTYSHMEKLLALDSGGKLENWEYYVFNAAGELVPLDMTVTIQKDAEGVITSAVCVLRDSTERKKAQKAIEEAYQFRTRFFTNITHEFRTPLTLTIGPLEELLRNKQASLTKSDNDLISCALHNATRLLNLINQLLDFSMLDSGAQSLTYEKKEINQFIASVLDSFSPLAKKKNIQLTYHPCACRSEVLIDPGKTEKVLFNVLGNAFKFTPEGGSITVQTALLTTAPTGKQNSATARSVSAATAGTLRISIADTGIGIPREQLSKIFNRFHRGGLESEKTYGGAGIGLAYAKELVEVMGGSISVESTCSSGSVFSVDIPIPDTANELQKTTPEPSSPPGVADPALSALTYREEVIQDCISGTKPLVLIVDDNPDMLTYIASILQHDYDYITAPSGEIALKRLKNHQPDIIVCDIMMPDMDGHELLKRVKSLPSFQRVPFVFLTAYADVEMKIESLDEGADDYIVKPFNALELKARIKSLLRIRTLMQTTEAQQKRITLLTQKLQEKYHYGNIIGSAPSMRKIYQLIEAIKDSDASVLITGETGTGKELVANAIHYNSLRRNKPMVTVNCGAIPRELMARELFGNVRGAYTGAVESRRGYFQEADGGTLFLDEIAEMDKDMQVQLLRVLERGEIIRVGDTVPLRVNVRLIAATNKNLLEEVKKGRFREDLYYRIHVIPIHLPPLRHRQEDIPLLVEHFLKKFRSKFKRNIPDFSAHDLELLMKYPYPGNVRELEHIIERYCLLGGKVEDFLGSHGEVKAGSSNGSPLQEGYVFPYPLKVKLKQVREQAEKEMILQALKSCGNNITKAATMLKISRVYLHEKIKKYGISITKL